MAQVETHSPTSIMFKVQRGAPELVTPAKPTPYEFKALSDIDNLEWFRIHVPILIFYPNNPSMNGVDPAKLIRAAIAETLVYYYPFAGRLREGSTGKLSVECSDEGILFIEADADVTLDQFGYPLMPPFSCSDQLLYEEPDANEILNCPLMFFQVTRLKCGGFIFGIRVNHTMCDAVGEAQFLSAIWEIARGATSPSTFPVWERHVLDSRAPPQLTFPLPEYNNYIPNITNEHDLCYRVFIFGPNEISTLRRCLPLHLRHYSSFEILAACVWKCHVIALQPHPTKQVTFIWLMNLRGKLNHIIPVGYYGNALGISIAISTAKEILENPLCSTLQLLKNAKKLVNVEDYDQSAMDLIANTYMMRYSASDLRYAKFGDVDFGWGKAVYGGPAVYVPMIGWHLMQFNRKKGENEIMLPICLSKQAMEIFEMEFKNMFKNQSSPLDDNGTISKL